MATFTSFSTQLPDPATRWGLRGEDAAATGQYGPGFSKVSVKSAEPIMSNNIQRTYSTVGSYHKWEFDISYNKVLKPEFDAVFTFLLTKQVSLEPFLVSIPQYASQTVTDKDTVGAKGKGDTTLLVTDAASNPLAPNPGDVFNVVGSTKVYKVTRVETNSEYYTPDGQPNVGEERIHFSPGLQADVAGASVLNFTDVVFNCVQEGNPGYSLDKTGLYSFSLKLMEV